MIKTESGNLTLKDPKLITIDHQSGHLAAHKIDDII